jgi:hypothetical protein
MEKCPKCGKVNQFGLLIAAGDQEEIPYAATIEVALALG